MQIIVFIRGKRRVYNNLSAANGCSTFFSADYVLDVYTSITDWDRDAADQS